MQKVEGAVCDDFFHSCDGALSHLSSRKNIEVPLERLGVGVVLVVTEEEVAEDFVKYGEFFYAVTPLLGIYREVDEFQCAVGGFGAHLLVSLVFPLAGSGYLASDVEHLLCQGHLRPSSFSE